MIDSKQVGRARKYTFRITILISLTLVVYWCVLLGNSALYEFSIPRDFREARWEGEFASAKHPTSGRLLVNLPDPIPRNQEFEFEAMLYYNIWSFFLTGKTARADFVGYLGTRDTVTTGSETEQSVVPRHFTFRLKGGGTPFPDDIRYTAVFDRDNQFVAGSYSAQGSFDVGYFSMEKH